ncbi:MAG TPA: hypothetical protein PLU71_05000 [Candidatus Dependentiae bacterium]|nr:hypothetical protein [Candidatus Dependentiae bacterium]HRQ63193.1 hypothetical protein [Candidatus Dependentiae bacterium]
MKSAQELISESRKLLNLITNESSIIRCRQYIEEFIEIYETYPSLTTVISSLEISRKDKKKSLSILEKKALKEIQRAFDVLTKKCAHKQIDIPQSIINDYQINISSAGYTVSKFDAVRDLILLLKAKQELSVIKRFVTLNAKGNIDTYTFSPSYFEWHQVKDDVKESAWYSYDQLLYLRNNTSDFIFVEEYPFTDDNQHLTMQILLARGFLNNPYNVMQYYKNCVNILHNQTKLILLNQQQKPDGYDKKTGIHTIDGKDTKYNPYSLRGKFLCLFYPNGTPRKSPLCFDEIYDKAIRTPTDPCWDDLDPKARKKIKKTIDDLYRGINIRSGKKLLKRENLQLDFV